MRAVTIAKPGGIEVLDLRTDVAVPRIGDGDALVRVVAAGVNRADVLERQGKYRGAPIGENGSILGMEYAGVIEALGADVRTWSVGARVCGLTPSAAYAEYVSTPAGTMIPIPANLSFEEGAAIPEAFITARDALFSLGAFGMGQTALIHAAGSGVALAASQLVRVAGGFAIGTTRTQAKLERLRDHAFDAAFLLGDDLPERLRAELGRRGIDVILDFIGQAQLAQNIAIVRSGGRIIQIGTMSGTKSTLDLGALLGKRAFLIGTVLRTRPLYEKEAIARDFRSALVPLFEAGRLKPVVDRVFDLADVAAAHTYMEDNANFGKIILRVSND